MAQIEELHREDVALCDKSARSDDGSWLNQLDFLWLEVTNRCNLHCKHCYAGSSVSEPETYGLTEVNWKKILSDAVALGCRSVQFIGGEPTLCSSLCRLIEHAHQTGYTFIEVYTNGVLLTPTLLAHFRAHDVHLAFSFYSTDVGVHGAITGSEHSYHKTLLAIKSAVAMQIPTRVGIIDLRMDGQDPERAVELMRSLGVTNVGCDRTRGIGRGNDVCQSTDPFKELCGACWQGKLAINSAGDVSPCVFSRFWSVGNVSEGLGTILDSIPLHDFRRRVQQMDAASRISRPTVDRACQPGECEPDDPSGGDGCPPEMIRCRPNMKGAVGINHSGDTCWPRLGIPRPDCEPGDCRPHKAPQMDASISPCGPSICKPFQGDPCVPHERCKPYR